MIDNKKVLAIIPARGGSKGIPKKNIKAISGKPMIIYTIEAAKECQYIDKVIVSTDNEEIAEIAMKAGAIVPFSRPEELATDEAELIGVVMHAVEFYERKGDHYDIIVLLPPTNPLRTGEDIQKALEYYIRKQGKSLLSISEASDEAGRMRCFGEQSEMIRVVENVKNEEKKEPTKYYKINGAIYINSMSELSGNTCLDDNELGYVLQKDHGISVDYPEDAVVAEYYLSQDCDGEFLSFIVY